MNKTHLIAAAVGLALVGTAAYVFLNNKSVETELDSHEGHNHMEDSGADLADQVVYREGQILSTGVNKLQKKKEHKLAADNNTETFEKDSIIWQESEQSKAVLQASGMMPGDVVDEAYVEVDLAELNSVEIGDSLDLYIPQLGGSYNGEVDYIQTHPNGDRTVEAFIPGAGTLYSAVITIGEDAIYGNLATQEDVFILEGIGKHAWIAPKSSMIGTHQERIPTEPQPSDTSPTDVFDVNSNESPTTTSNNN